MNGIDLIVILVLLLGLWNGWRRGAVVQLCSLLGMAAGVWLAWRTGAAAGVWLGLDEALAAPVGFVAVLAATVLAVAVLAHVVRRLGRLAGLGWLDTLLGIVFAVAKHLLVLSLLFRAFDRMNGVCAWVDPHRLEASATYVPVMRLSEPLLPLAEWAEGRLPSAPAGDGEARRAGADGTERFD